MLIILQMGLPSLRYDDQFILCAQHHKLSLDDGDALFEALLSGFGSAFGRTDFQDLPSVPCPGVRVKGFLRVSFLSLLSHLPLLHRK